MAYQLDFFPESLIPDMLYKPVDSVLSDEEREKLGGLSTTCTLSMCMNCMRVTH